ncbi:MAG: hypothetical protein H6969_11775 [Gammaproteobacteria bacterium]|nr:hypothetical protein [Gammaproteobacteria bacterium]
MQDELRDENHVAISKSLSVEKHRVSVGTLIAAFVYDLSPDKRKLKIPGQGEKRERDSILWEVGVLYRSQTAQEPHHQRRLLTC